MNRALLTFSLMAAAAGCGEQVIDVRYAAQLALLEVTPASGPSIGGTTVTLRGRRFCPDLTVTFGGAPATRVNVASDELAVAVAPSGARGEVPLEIRCGDSRATSPSAWRYFATNVAFQRDLDMPPLLGEAAFGDIDADGLDDLFDVRTSELAIFRNTGRNGFESQPSVVIPFPAGETTSPFYLPFKLGDFTGDGTADVLAFLRSGSGGAEPARSAEIVVRLYAGETAFAEAGWQRLPSSPNPRFFSLLDIVDLDGDGRLDLVVSDKPDGLPAGVAHRVSLLPGLGRAAFGTGRTLFDVTERPDAVAVGALEQSFIGNDRLGPPARRDLDGDGIDDLVAMSWWLGPGQTLSGSLTYVRGARDGAPFTVVQTDDINAGEGLFFYDADPLPDLYSIARAGTAPSRRMTVRRATGFGTFESAPRIFELPCNYRDCRDVAGRLVPTRFNTRGDARGEWLLLTNGVNGFARTLEWLQLGGGTVELLEIAGGPQAGTWSQRFRGMPRMRRNGQRALLYDSIYPRAAYFETNGEGRVTFRHTPPLLEPLDMFLGCSGDFDGDGIPDLLATRPVAGQAIVYRGDGRGGFDVAATVPYGETGQCGVGHFDGDGRLDFRLNRSIFLNRAGEGFLVSHLDTVAPDWAPDWFVMAELDLDRDGLDDLVIRRGDPLTPGKAFYRLLLASVDGVFRPSTELGDWQGADNGAVADLDGDGLPDLARLHSHQDARGRRQTLAIEMGRRPAGGGGLQLVPLPLFDVGAFGNDAIQITDVDRDGRSEVMLAADLLREVRLLGVRGDSVEILARASDQNSGRFAAACNLRGRGGAMDLAFVAEPSLIGFSLRTDDDNRLASPIQWLDVPRAVFEGPALGTNGSSLCLDADGDGLDDFLFVDRSFVGTAHTFRAYMLRNVSR